MQSQQLLSSSGFPFILIIFTFIRAEQLPKNIGIDDDDATAVQKCTDLLAGQYWCDDPVISEETQLPTTCSSDNSIEVQCTIIDGINCTGASISTNGTTNTYYKRIENGCSFSSVSILFPIVAIGCYRSGKEYETALLLSILLGFLGIDRLYLGYWAIGLFKMFTLGFFGFFYLIDIILIALQLLTPADGTAYRMDYYGPKLTPIRFSNTTFIADL